MNTHKVIWQEGMLLRPQHFQHNDRYYDHQMKNRTQLQGSFMWGFLRLEANTSLLEMGKFGISHAAGIFPDASLFEHNKNDQPLILDVPPGTGNTPIFLALPLVTGNHVEARRVDQSDVLARYTAYEAELADSNATDASTVKISCGRPDLKLLLGNQADDHAYVKLKVGHVLDTNKDGTVILDPDFEPSYLRTHASGYLKVCLAEAISLLSNRGDAIAKYIRSDGKVAAAEIGDFMMLQLINRTEAVLNHLSSLDQVHPEELYRTLLTLLGELATFSRDDKRQRMAPSYQHSDQGNSFRTLMDAIRYRLSMVLEQHAIQLTMEKRRFGVTVGLLKDPSLLTSAQFVLTAKGEGASDELRHRLPAHLKVGSVEDIRQLINLQLVGIKITPMTTIPRQLVYHTNTTYFALELDAAAQKNLAESTGIAFHTPDEFDDLELELWAIRN